MASETLLREHLLELLGGGHAHLNFEKAIAGLPVVLRGARPPGLPHTPWRLVEHMRIAQWDILRFSVDPAHVSPEFPDGYWPAGDAPPNANAWDRSVAAFRADLQAMNDLVRTLTPTFSNPSSTARDRRSSARSCWSLITTRTTWDSSSPCADCSAWDEE